MKTRIESFADASRYAPHYPPRCGKALDEAILSTPAYQVWRKRDPGDSTGVFSRLASLSALTKHDLRTHGPGGFVPHGRSLDEGLASGQIELVNTSGTTGDRVSNVWYQPWWDASEAASSQLNSHARSLLAGGHREAILTSPWCTGFPCEDGFLTLEQRTAGRFLYLSERSDPSLWPESLMDRMIDDLNRFRPSILEANPSFLAKLARHIVRAKLRVFHPPLIILTYENPSVLHLRQIRRAFESPIASSYGSTEAGYVFMECEAGRLHQVTDSCHVDFLPLAAEHGGPDVGRILVTTFDNPWRSLVRFDTGDIVRLSRQTPCPCGRHEGLTLLSVEGRTVNLTLTPGGRAVTQGAVDRVLGNVTGLLEYQLVQTGPAAYTLGFAAGEPPARQVAGEVRDVLQSLYGPAASITTNAVEAITPDPPGKYRLTRALSPIDADYLLDTRFAPQREPDHDH